MYDLSYGFIHYLEHTHGALNGSRSKRASVGSEEITVMTTDNGCFSRVCFPGVCNS
jgi:hypothetical protein